MAKSNGCLLLLRVLFILLNFCVHIVRRVGFVRCRRLHLTLQFPLNIEYIQWFVRVFIYRHFGDAYFVLLMSCTAKTKMFSDQRCFRKRNTLHILFNRKALTLILYEGGWGWKRVCVNISDHTQSKTTAPDTVCIYPTNVKPALGIVCFLLELKLSARNGSTVGVYMYAFQARKHQHRMRV